MLSLPELSSEGPISLYAWDRSRGGNRRSGFRLRHRATCFLVVCFRGVIGLVLFLPNLTYFSRWWNGSFSPIRPSSMKVRSTIPTLSISSPRSTKSASRRTPLTISTIRCYVIPRCFARGSLIAKLSDIFLPHSLSLSPLNTSNDAEASHAGSADAASPRWAEVSPPHQLTRRTTRPPRVYSSFPQLNLLWAPWSARRQLMAKRIPSSYATNLTLSSLSFTPQKLFWSFPISPSHEFTEAKLPSNFVSPPCL